MVFFLFFVSHQVFKQMLIAVLFQSITQSTLFLSFSQLHDKAGNNQMRPARKMNSLWWAFFWHVSQVDKVNSPSARLFWAVSFDINFTQYVHVYQIIFFRQHIIIIIWGVNFSDALNPMQSYRKQCWNVE